MGKIALILVILFSFNAYSFLVPSDAYGPPLKARKNKSGLLEFYSEPKPQQKNITIYIKRDPRELLLEQARIGLPTNKRRINHFDNLQRQIERQQHLQELRETNRQLRELKRKLSSDVWLF